MDTTDRTRGKFIAVPNEDGRTFTVRIVNPRNGNKFRKVRMNRLEDVPSRNLSEDNARLAAAHYTQNGNPRKGEWE